MLSVPTLWTVFVINFLALGLIWAYVVRSYPKLEAARFWTGSAFAAAIGAALAIAAPRVRLDSLLPLLSGGTAHPVCDLPRRDGHAAVLRPAGVLARHRADHRPRPLPALSFFIFVHDSVPMRMTGLFARPGDCRWSLTSSGCCCSPQDGRVNPGARLAGIVTIADPGDFRGAGGRRSWPAPTSRSPQLGPGAVGDRAAADVPVDVAQFRLPADGDGPAAQRGRRSRAARRSHRRRQPAASAAAADRGMRAVGTQRRAVRAAGDRSRRLQG